MPQATISRATSGAGTPVIAAVTGKRIVIHGYVFIADDAVDVKFQYGDGVTQVDLTGVMSCVTASGASAWPPYETPAFHLPASKGFYLHLSDNVQVSGHVRYSVVS